MRDTILKAPVLADSVLQEEIELETLALQEGAQAYHKLKRQAIKRGEGAQLKPAERLLQHWFETYEGLIKDEQKACRKGTPGVGRAVAGPILVLLPADELAVLAMHQVVSECMAQSSGVPLNRLAHAVGSAVMAELNLRGLAKEGKVAELDRKFKRRRPSRINWWAKKNLEEPWTARTSAVQVGAVLINVLIESASTDDYMEKFKPAFRKVLRRKGRKTPSFLVMDREAYRIIDEGHATRSHLRPKYLPMIVEPYRWSDKAQGGYVRVRTPLTSKPTPGQKAALSATDKTLLYDGLHAVGATPLRVNRSVYGIQCQVWALGGGFLNLPHKHDRPDVPFPKGYDATARPRDRWLAVDPAVKKAHKQESAANRRENYRRRSDRKEFLEKIGVADLFVERPRFWYPHQLDFRGRVYPIPAHLNAQGDDVARGLLELAEGKPVGERGRWWIAVAAANAWGVKGTFADRVGWTRASLDMIAAVVSDPIACEWWQPQHDPKGRQIGGAEDPWQFLAACFALFNDEAAAHFPLKQDGTCNGLQHYAALSRDAKAAAKVNMLPGDRPEDVYGDVAIAVRPVVAADAAGSDETFTYTSKDEAGEEKQVTVQVRDLAGAVSSMTERPVVKQVVMTTTYGVTKIGAREQIYERLKERGLEGRELYNASRYLAKIVMDGIGEVCAGATAVMEWLRKCAEIIAGAGEPVRWTTPVGMPVVQPYRNYRKRTVKTVLQEFTLLSPEEDVPVNVRKQTNGIAPNFVHGLDAAHWMMTAIACRNAGVAAVGVHDCYITHAATADAMGLILRQQFVNLHTRPLLQELVESWRARHPDLVFPNPPPRGSLDLNLVLDAPYFFS